MWGRFKRPSPRAFHMARRNLGLDVTVSPLLEQKAMPEQKDRKIDLVDFLFNVELIEKIGIQNWLLLQL